MSGPAAGDQRPSREPRFAAIVLAAGAATRFSGDPGAKLVAQLDGRPLVTHVLETLRRFGPAATVVVTGAGADRVEALLDPVRERVVRNPDPGRGLASSLRIGFERLLSLDSATDGVFVVLGDQPRLRLDVLRTLAEAASATLRAGGSVGFVVPRYGDDPGARNPTLVLRRAYPLARTASGDTGLARLMADYPESVLSVAVTGANPDVDTPSDLERLAGPEDRRSRTP